MAEAFQGYGLAVPNDLLQAQENWLASGNNLALPAFLSSRGHDETRELEHDDWDGHDALSYDGQLASVYLLPLFAGEEARRFPRSVV